MNTENLLSDELATLERVLTALVGLDGRHVAEFREIMFRRQLNKKPEVIVTVSFVPDYLWFINSVSLAELKTKRFPLMIKISDSTNLKIDKADYIGAVHKSLTSLLGRIHPVSNTAIQEMKADAYGYDGLTIEYKYINNQKKNDSIPT